MAGKSRKSVNNKKIICVQCRMEVKEETEDSIECDKCCKVLHVMCAKLDKRRYEQLLKDANEVFVCHICNGNDESYTMELKRIDAKLCKLDHLTEAMNFMSSKFDEMMKGVSENKKKINNIEKENLKLKNEIKTLKESVKFLNDNRVKNDCVVIGVNVKEGASAAETIIDVSKSIGVELKKENIEEAYFLKKHSNAASAKQNLVVKFNTKSAKENLMQSKIKFKDYENTKSVYVNDFLSKESLELFNYAKTLKSVGYHSVYSNGGKIYARKSQINKPRIIRSAEDVDNILYEASTNKAHKRRSARYEVVADDESEISDGENHAQFESPDGI